SVKLVQWNKDVVEHFPVIRQKESIVPSQVNGSRKIRLCTLHNLNHLTFAFPSGFAFIYVNFYNVAVQRLAQFSRGNENIVFVIFFRNNISRTVCCHVDLSGHVYVELFELKFSALGLMK